MAVGERERRELQEALVDTIGPEQTDTLLGYLPPTGWADVATKRDLEVLDAKFDAKFEAIEARIRALQWMVGLLILLVAAVLGTALFR
ncbi:MAG TPA: hypothetical protein VFJ19_04845 [Nocardioidaceae bacterium]|nr:hypothetical protein [Nocardioidaceae bacterium]